MAITRFKNSSIANKGPKYDTFGAGLPSTPTIGTVTVTNATTVSVPFTAGGSGGSPITSYTVISSPSITLTVTGTSSPLTVTGTFAQNQAYTFQVRANNDNGSSAYSASSNSVTPLAKPVVTGGTLTSDATYYYRTFTANGTLGITGGSLVCDYRLLGGGGGGGGGLFIFQISKFGNNIFYSAGGGGGGGGAVKDDTQTLTVGDYSVVIGAGGAWSDNGFNSTFNSKTAYGGGGGGYIYAGSNGTTNSSGGGGSGNFKSEGSLPNGGQNGGTGYGVGKNGGNGWGNDQASQVRGGGGGGLGSAGTTASSTVKGNGGTGEDFFSLGTTRGGGGGGGSGSGYAPGDGSGGGANGTEGTGGTPSAATANRGGGGGGGGRGNGTTVGSSGGSGILIVRYTKSQVD